MKLIRLAQDNFLAKQYNERFTMATWQCSKCGTVVQSNARPMVTRCPKGGFYQWQKLCN